MTARSTRRSRGRPLVLGLGNVLLGDDGVGVAVARELAARRLSGVSRVPAGTAVVDGGTLGLDLLPIVEDASEVVLIDAVDHGRPPGTLEVLRGAELRAALRGHLSGHEAGLADLLAVAQLRGGSVDRFTLVAVQPGNVAVSLGLSEAVAAVVPIAAEAVCRQLAGRPG